MHEIITLQFGQRSNYAATHFWNVQESYFTYSGNEESPVNHNIHFRGGVGADASETFTPRTIIYDLKGGFGTLRKYNALYQLEQEDGGQSSGLWDGNEVIQQQPKIPQSEYQRCLDLGLPAPRLSAETVRYWSDFNRVFYNPKSIQQLNEYDLGSQLMPFENWSVGQSLFSDLDREHDLLDRDLRPFAEECDQLKGIQIFTGADDAWGGFTASYIERLKDEFGRKSIWVWALNGPSPSQGIKRKLASENMARSIGEISSQVSAYIPIAGVPSRAPPQVKQDLRHVWYSSALVSLALESVTLPTRLRAYETLDLWEESSRDPRNIFKLETTIDANKSAANLKDNIALDAARPDPKMYRDEEGRTQNQRQYQDIDLSPMKLGENQNPQIFKKISVQRDSRGAGSTLVSSTSDVHSTFGTHSFASQLEYPVLDSFPHDLLSGQCPMGSTLKIDAALSVSAQTAEYLKDLQRSVSAHAASYQREELSNNLATLAEVYTDGWEEDSDSGDD